MTDREKVMNDRETVIKALEYCAVGTNDCFGCPLTSKCKGVINAAMVAALKYIKPRVLTIEEVLDPDYFDPVRLEVPDLQGTPWVSVHGFPDEGIVRLRRLYADPEDAPIAEYGKTWRCWSGRPTAEQRKKVKWDD